MEEQREFERFTLRLPTVIETTGTGQEEETFDLMLLDIIMPEMDGIDLCRRIRQLEHHKETPIAFLTAKSQEADKAKGLEAGATLFLSKPISPEKLLEFISKAMA